MAREELCLRGTTDYWINDREGRPFFVVNTVANPGLIAVLRQEIIPRLLTVTRQQKDPPMNRRDAQDAEQD